jgi:hypothetical protein
LIGQLRSMAAPDRKPPRPSSATTPERASNSRAPSRQPEPSSGFRANLQGATIADLVQLECLAARPRVSVRVTSEARTGYLFFDRGKLLHAELEGQAALNRQGEGVALEILSWDHGDFEAWQRNWPLRHNITSSWQHLVLEAARQRDEHLQRGRELGNEPAVGRGESELRVDTAVVPLLPAGNVLPVVEPALALSTGIGAERSARAGPRGSAPARERLVAMNANTANGTALSDLSWPLLRLDADGNVLENRGAPEELGGVISYAARLAQLIGEALGIEELEAIECVYKEQRCVTFASNDAELTSVLAPLHSDLSALRRSLKL